MRGQNLLGQFLVKRERVRVMMSNRREFISKVATICVAGLSIGKLTGAHAAMVSESDPNAKALGYVADASNAKR